MNFKKTLFVISTIFILVLAACGGEATNVSSEDAVTQEITVNLGGEPYTVDPAFASDTTSYWVIDHLYEGLYQYDEDGEVVEGSASDIDVSEDGTIYTFTIRDDAEWSNGDALTAHDFEYAWKRILDPETAAYDPSQFYYIAGAEEYNNGEGDVEDVQIIAEDDHTLVVELKHPVQFFPTVLLNYGYLPVNKNVVEEDEDWAADEESIITNGSYIVSVWEHDDHLTLEKNENYWNIDAITMDTIDFKMIEDTTTEYQMYQSGALDLVTSLPSEAIPQEKDSDEFINHPSFSVYTYTFNVEEEPFTNAKIRQALSYAIDREAITENITQGGEIPAYGYVANGITTPADRDFREEAEPYYTFDVDKAQELLEEGLKEEGWDELPPFALKYNSEDNHKKIAESLQEMFKQNLALEVTLENQEWNTFIDTFKQKNFQIARMGWVGDFLDPYPVLDLYTTNSSSNFTNWSNEEFDALLEESLTEQDEEKRFELLHAAEDVLMEDMPVIPILFSATNGLMSEKVDGILFDPLNQPNLRYAERIAK